jgi:Flp pilus assembly pilin Flp
MKQFPRLYRSSPLLCDDRGLSTVEYVIILVLIAAAAVGTWSTFGGTIVRKINDANGKIESDVIIDGNGSNGANSPSKSIN